MNGSSMMTKRPTFGAFLLAAMLRCIAAYNADASVNTCTACPNRVNADASADWRAEAAYLGDPRHHPLTFSDGESGFLMAGINDKFDAYKFNPETRAWTTLTFPQGSPVPPWRRYSYAVAIGEIAYMGFGIGEISGGLRDFWAYNMKTNTFTELQSFPGTARWHPAMVAVEADRGAGSQWYIYVVAGSSAGGNLNDCYEYQVASNKWIKRDDLPGPPRHPPYYSDGKTADGKHLAFVGFGHAAKSNGYIKKDWYAFDPVELSWKKKADFPGEARVAGTQFSHSFGNDGTNYVYILSGDGDNHGFMAEGEMYEYDPNIDEWRKLKSHPGNSLWAPGNFVIGCRVYMTSGYDRKAKKSLNTMVSYPLSDCAPTSIPTTTAPTTQAPITRKPTGADVPITARPTTNAPTGVPTASPTFRNAGSSIRHASSMGGATAALPLIMFMLAR